MGSIPQDDNGCDMPSETHPRAVSHPAPESPLNSQVELLLTGTSWELESGSAGQSNCLADYDGEIFLPPDFCGFLNYGAGFYAEFYKQHNFCTGSSNCDPYDRCGRITTSEEYVETESPDVYVWTFNLSHTPDLRLCPAELNVPMDCMKAQLRHDFQNDTKTLTYRWNSAVWTLNSRTSEREWRYPKFVWKTKARESV